MKKHYLNGFSLIELIVVISISSIIISSLFFVFSNINLITHLIKSKDDKTIQIAHFYNQIKNDLSHAVPGKIGDEPGFLILNDKELSFYRLAFNLNNPKFKKIIKITWHEKNGNLYRLKSDIGEINNTGNQVLFYKYGKDIFFKGLINKKNNPIFSSPSAISLIFGSDAEEIYTFRIGNN